MDWVEPKLLVVWGEGRVLTNVTRGGGWGAFREPRRKGRSNPVGIWGHSSEGGSLGTQCRVETQSGKEEAEVRPEVGKEGLI